MVTFEDLGKYGRLGNQLFQIASTIGIAIRNGMEFGFPEWEYDKHFSSRLPKINKNLFKRTYEEQSPYYQDIRLSNDTDWNLKGYFQSWKYFHHCQSSIHYYLEFKRPAYNGVAVHVRRGDYLGLQHIHPVLPLHYYTEAMQQFSGEHFTIFSDDIQWCKEYLKGWNISYYPVEDDIHDFKAMSGFEKFIIANSSYSWWAAYLRRTDKVIAPKNYVVGETKDDRIPDWWRKI